MSNRGCARSSKRFSPASVAFEGKDLKILQWAGASAAYDLVKASIADSA